MSLIDDAYSNAADLTGKTEDQLRSMAAQIFGSMLYHASQSPGRIVWTIAIITPGRLDCRGRFRAAQSVW